MNLMKLVMPSLNYVNESRETVSAFTYIISSQSFFYISNKIIEIIIQNMLLDNQN